MSQPVGTGTIISLGNGASPEVFTELFQILAIGDMALSAKEIDKSTHNAARSSKFLRKMTGMINAGSIDVTIHYDPNNATHAKTGTGVIALLKARTANNWKLTLSEEISPAATWSILAYVQSFKESHPFDEKLTAVVTLLIDGEPT